MSESKQVSVKIYLPEDLRARFKSACALRKVSMNEVLLDFVQEWTEENEKPPTPPPQPEKKEETLSPRGQRIRDARLRRQAEKQQQAQEKKKKDD